jgi:hypothetical protein
MPNSFFLSESQRKLESQKFTQSLGTSPSHFIEKPKIKKSKMSGLIRDRRKKDYKTDFQKYFKHVKRNSMEMKENKSNHYLKMMESLRKGLKITAKDSKNLVAPKKDHTNSPSKNMRY